MVHVLVVTHTTFVAHTMSSSGELQHEHLEAEAAHLRHTGSTWCGSPAELKLAADTACTAAKLAQMSASFEASQDSTSGPVDSTRVNAQYRLARNPLTALSRAPKASPPA